MSCLPSWLKADSARLILQIKVKPNARQNKIALDSSGSVLQIHLQASAQDGKANKMLVQYLSDLLGLPQKQIVILRGLTSRMKTLSLKVGMHEQKALTEKLISAL